MNNGRELIEALNQIEKEKGISKDILLEAMENSLVAACKNEYGKADNIRVNIDRETGDVVVYAEKEVVEEVEDDVLEISLANARLRDIKCELGILSMWKSLRETLAVLLPRRQNRWLFRKSVKKNGSPYITSIMIRKEIL